MKKYRIRELSILWWTKYILIAVAIFSIFIGIMWGVQ